MRKILRKTPGLRNLAIGLVKLYYGWLNWCHAMKARGQSDETRIIAKLAKDAPRTFVEFGFEPSEFNCAALAWNKNWRGLLIDGNPTSIANARKHLPAHLNIVETFLTKDNLGFIKNEFDKIGVLSIDVDGNDYWFLEQLIDTQPTVISVEYNATFGLEPITIPYEPEFRRHEKHSTGWYHGASLAALAKLVAAYGYGLAAVSTNGTNAFFTKGGNLDPAKAWRPNKIRAAASQIDQWNTVKHLPIVTV